MVPSTREGYRYLQVDRLVLNRPGVFLAKVTELGSRIFGEITRSALEEQGLANMDGQVELRTHTVPVGEPVLDVYKPDEVRVLLLRKSVPSHKERHYNFNHHATRFTALPKMRLKKGAPQVPKQPPTIREKLDQIAHAYHEDPKNMTVEFNRIEELSDLGFGTELALTPRIGQVGSIILREQAKLCSEELAQLSSNAAYPTSPSMPTVPFMRVPEDINHRQYDRFITELYEHVLPLQLVIGGLDAHSRTIASRGC